MLYINSEISKVGISFQKFLININNFLQSIYLIRILHFFSFFSDFPLTCFKLVNSSLVDLIFFKLVLLHFLFFIRQFISQTFLLLAPCFSKFNIVKHLVNFCKKFILKQSFIFTFPYSLFFKLSLSKLLDMQYVRHLQLMFFD